jgi:hypothetical protein
MSTTKNTYRLINPHIEGSIDTVVHASNSFSAGKKMYNNISKYFTNHLSDFYMTLQNVENKNLSHFKITEKRGKNGAVDYKMIKMSESFDPDTEEKIVETIDNISNQSAGKKNSSDSSSSSSSDESSDFFHYQVQPITRFVYYYLPYYKLNFVGMSPADINRVYVPMFNFPINPTMEIRFDLYQI